MSKVFAAVLLTLTLLASALAHEGGHHVQGTVREISADRLVLTGANGQSVTFVVTKATEFYRAGKPVKPGDAKAGDRAVVHGAAGGGNTAAEVMLGAAQGAR